MKSSQNHLPSLLSTILFLLGGMFLLGIAGLMGVSALASVLTGEGSLAGQAIFLVAFGFEALLLFAAAFFALQKYLARARSEQQITLALPGWQLLVLLGIAAASILIGYFLDEAQATRSLLLPLLTIPAIVMPLAVLLALGTNRLPLGSRWRTWTILGLAMTLGPIILFALEIIVAIVFFVGFVVYLMTRPPLVAELQRIAEQIMLLGPQSEEAIELLVPLLTEPAVMALVLLYVAVLVPTIEEIFKPIGVWLFARKLDSSAQGFALGALSGAGYALIETIGVSGQQTADWAELLFSRIGTGLLHITTSALVGAAIVTAVRQRRYLGLLGAYLAAVTLHGLWNALAMGFTFSTLAHTLEPGTGMNAVQTGVLAAMAFLAVLLFAILLLLNRRLRRGLPGAEPEPSRLPADSDPGQTL